MFGTKQRQQQRRREWINQVLEQYEERLMRYATRLLGDSERAKDVVQDTFVALCNAAPNDVESYLAQWLFTVCRHRVIDIKRKEQPMMPTPMEQLGREQETVSAADRSLESKQESHRMLALLARLPENQQEVIRLKFQSDLSYREIAKVTGLSETNVGYLIHIGIKRLREEFALNAAAVKGGAK